MIDPRMKGRFAETIAADHLITMGWKVLARNVKISHGELDIVALDTTIRPSELVIVEVRARTIGKIQSPLESVGPRKLKSLVKYSRALVEKVSWEKFWRIDLIGITFEDKISFQKWRLDHVKDITAGRDIYS